MKNNVTHAAFGTVPSPVEVLEYHHLKAAPLHKRVKLSLVIPCYNAEKTLRACLQSASGQTHPAIEIIVVDDKSSDRSRAIAGEFRCTLIEQPRNKGVSAARNAGAAAGRGEILFFLDGDDLFLPDHLILCRRALLDEPTLDFVKTGVRLADPVHPDW